MQRLTAVLWFVAAFLGGAALFLATRPAPVLNAMVIELTGGNLFDRCREAGACGKAGQPPPLPASRPPQLPADIDRG
ncbi:MAG TPA: hypothetical protein VJL82_04270 [Rhizomicrobium sp.]|nr:hypothetical protein [Rhizomicrobium sp.]